jgi:hypothetical protein
MPTTRLLLALVLMLPIIGGWCSYNGSQRSFGQQNSPQITRKPACGCYVCGLSYEPFDDRDNGCAGILAEDACPSALSQMPAESRAAFCQRVKTVRKFSSFKDACPGLASICESGSSEPSTKRDCEPPPPWQNASSSKTSCKDIQSPQVSINQGVVSLAFCGYAVWSYAGRAPDGQVDNAFNQGYQSTLTKWVKAQIGSRVCCDKFQEAIQRGQTCDPRVDVDCDGKPNGSDSVWSSELGASLPDINIFKKSEGAPVDRFPPGLDPDDPNFMPPYEKCDCKWELLKGTLTCSMDGKQPHVYQAKWKCPATGNELLTRKEAPASAPCEKP